MKRHRKHVALAHGDGVALDLGQDLHPRTGVGHPGGADEDGVDGSPRHPGHVQVGLEVAQLAAEGVAPCLDVEHTKMGAGRA